MHKLFFVVLPSQPLQRFHSVVLSRGDFMVIDWGSRGVFMEVHREAFYGRGLPLIF